MLDLAQAALLRLAHCSNLVWICRKEHIIVRFGKICCKATRDRQRILQAGQLEIITVKVTISVRASCHGCSSSINPIWVTTRVNQRGVVTQDQTTSLVRQIEADADDVFAVDDRQRQGTAPLDLDVD